MNILKNTIIRYIFIFSLLGVWLAVFPTTALAQYHTSTVRAVNIGENSATLHGYVNAFFSNTTKRWFQWGDSPDSFSRETSHNFVSGGVEAFEETISGLSPHTTYFFRTAAQNAGEGAIFGEVKSFTTVKGTSAGTISITTGAVSSVGSFSATVTCSVDPQGNSDTQRWVDWGRSASTLVSTEKKYQSVAGSYSVILSNLSQNTVYYFRCAAKTRAIHTIYGNLLSFTTNANTAATPVFNSFTGNNQTFNAKINTSTFVSQTVATKPATNIADTSAQLNAVALLVGSAQTYGWFLWGNTPDLGRFSTRRFLGADRTLPFNETISGLTPGTTYFFKPIIENQNGTSDGTLFSFHTTGTRPVAVTPNSGTSNAASAITSIRKKEVKLPVASEDDKKTLKVEVIPNNDVAAPNERIHETIQIENTTDTTITSVTVRVILPCELEYIATGGDDFTKNGQMLTHKVGKMKPKQKVSLLLWAKVGADVSDKTPVETIAVVGWADMNHTNDGESVGRATITVDKNKTAKENIAAADSAKSADSVFPHNLKSWGFVVGFLFLLVLAYTVFVIVREKKDEETLAEAVSLEEAPVRPNVSPAGVPPRSYIKDPFVSDNTIQKSKTIPRVVPMKKAITEKGVPPENLPI